MKISRRDLGLAVILALGVFALDLSFLSKGYVFEGLIRAMPIETGRWVHLFAGNYLLYGPLGLVFHTFLRLLGASWPAIISLQIMDALIGSAGVGVFYLTLRRLDGDRFSAGIWAGVLAFSLGYWLWSTDAEDYILSTFLLITHFYFWVRYLRGEQIDPLLLGALQGLAILGHIINTLFGAVGIWFLISRHRARWAQPTARFLAGAAIVALGAYLAVIFWVQKPPSAHAAWMWFMGSAGAKADGLTLGGFWSLDKMWEWLKMSLHIFVSFNPAWPNPAAWKISQLCVTAACFLLGVFALAFLVRFDETYRKHSTLIVGCGLWIAAYALIFTRWEPWTMVYRVSDLVPLCVLLFLGYQSIPAHRRIWQGAAALMVFCLMIGNLGAEIYPRSFDSNNPNLQHMAFLKANTAESDWITGDSGRDEIYIPYFAERRPVVVERFRQNPERLILFLKDLAAHHQTVFVTSHTLEWDLWKDFFKNYTLSQKAVDHDGFVLYQLGRYHGDHAR